VVTKRVMNSCKCLIIVFSSINEVFCLFLSSFITNSKLKLSPRYFEKFKNLLHLYLENTGITEIPKNVFKGLGKLKKLVLKGNKLKLSSGCFKDVSTLETLDLENTGLKEVSTEYFNGLHKLSTLHLSRNFLTTFPRNFMDVMKSKTDQINLFVSGNKWDCRCESGLQEALENLEHVHIQDDAYCHTPEAMRGRRISDPNCDINECLTENDCDDEAVCINVLKGYKCHCATQGFTGNGRECSDIDECEYKNLCAPVGGKCVNEQGKYRCECIKGYKGDGKTCEDIDECETHDCGGEGECTNTQGSFRCDCESGYEKNDIHVCVDIDECETANHTCNTIENSYCFNLRKLLPKDPGYKCACDSGYLKVGSACVKRGSTLELLKYIGVIVGSFLVGLLLIIVGTLKLRKRMQRRLEAQQLLENALMAPIVPMPPPVEFASLDMPPPEKDQEWEEDDEEG